MSEERKEQLTGIEAVARLAMRVSQPHLADYGATTSRHDFTQRQLLSCLIVRAYLKTTYRGLLEFLKISPNLRRELHHAPQIQHTQSGIGNRANTHCSDGNCCDRTKRSSDGCHGFDGAGDDHGERLFPEPAGQKEARLGKSFGDYIVREFVAAGSGGGSWTEQRPGASSGTVASRPGCRTCRNTVCRCRLRCRMDSCTMPGRMGSGKFDQTQRTKGRWPAQWPMASSDESPTPQRASVWEALGSGNFLQRAQANDGRSFECAHSRSTTGRSRYQSAGLRASPLARQVQSRSFQQSN